MISVVGHVRPTLRSRHLASFRLDDAQAGDLAICYVRIQHAVGPPAWTEARADRDGALFWKVLLGFERAARFHGATPIDLDRCFGVIYRGVFPADPVEPGFGVPILSLG